MNHVKTMRNCTFRLFSYASQNGRDQNAMPGTSVGGTSSQTALAWPKRGLRSEGGIERRIPNGFERISIRICPNLHQQTPAYPEARRCPVRTGQRTNRLATKLRGTV